MTEKMRIALIYGGWSSEREISLIGGRCVYEALDKAKYEVTLYDPLHELKKLIADAEKLDLAFIVLHGRFGEDGRIQGLLDILEVPYVGSGVLASATAVNKKMTKGIYRKEGFLVAKDVFLKRDAAFSANHIFTFLGNKAVVKPIEEGSSLGMSVCENEDELIDGIEKAFGFGNEIMVEEYLKGREVSCCILGNDDAAVLPIVEIIPHDKYRFFDYEAKYRPGASKEICPADIGVHLEEQVRRYGVGAHNALGCSVWSRTDMVIQNDRVYVLETNTIPGMTPNSLFPLAAKTAGMNFSGLIERLIQLSVE